MSCTKKVLIFSTWRLKDRISTEMTQSWQIVHTFKALYCKLRWIIQFRVFFRGTSYRNPDLHNILSSAPFLFTFCFLNVENLSKIYTLHIYPILKVGSPHSNRVAVCLGVSLYQVLHHHSRCSTSDCNPNLHSILINNSLKCRKFV